MASGVHFKTHTYLHEGKGNHTLSSHNKAGFMFKRMGHACLYTKKNSLNSQLSSARKESSAVLPLKFQERLAGHLPVLGRDRSGVRPPEVVPKCRKSGGHTKKTHHSDTWTLSQLTNICNHRTSFHNYKHHVSSFGLVVALMGKIYQQFKEQSY